MNDRPKLLAPPSGGPAALSGRRPAFGEVTGASAPQPDGPADDPDPPPEEPPDPVQELADRLAERTADLLRVKAEYDNYRKRVRRDRLAVREIAVANVLARLLPVLDALEAARAQGRLVDGLAAVGEVLESELAGLGLRPFGEPGDPFDPAVHTAVAGGAAGRPPVCVEILRRGYLVGGQLLRPAEVVVGSVAADE